MMRPYRLLWISFFCLQPHFAWGATLHALVVCDTHAVLIEASVAADHYHITKEIKKICKYTKLQPKIKEFTGVNVTSAILDAIHKLRVERDDVIIFYWSGHGKRLNSQTDPWPVFDFEHDDHIVTQLSVTEELIKKNARLILSLSDCCNDYAPTPLGLIPKGKKSILKENYQRLFLDSSGTYIAAAASPGEFAFGVNIENKRYQLQPGGFFTNALLEVLHKETKKLNPFLCWERIFELTINKTIEYQLRNEYDPKIYHFPQYLYIPNSF